MKQLLLLLLLLSTLSAETTISLPIAVNCDATVTAVAKEYPNLSPVVIELAAGDSRTMQLPTPLQETGISGITQTGSSRSLTSVTVHSGEIVLTVPVDFIRGEVSLFSVNGREVGRSSLMENRNSFLAENLSAGVYLMRAISTNGETFTHKVALSEGTYHLAVESSIHSLSPARSVRGVAQELITYQFTVDATSDLYRDSTFELSLAEGMNSSVEINLIRLMSPKKGVAKTIKTDGWEEIVAKLTPYWHYSWGWELKDQEPQGIEFVPMIWGRTSKLDERINYLKNLASKGEIEYLLGFNEPDGAKQADMTVDETIALWPKLESVGVPLGSPAATNAEGEWLQEFMTKAEENNLRVDFITVHYYGGTSATSFMNKLKRIYNLYRKPIWITEFAAADWSASTIEANRHTPAAVLNYMKALLPQLEATDYIERYSWFSFDLTREEGWSSALYDEQGNLTELGEYYANFGSSN